MPHRLKGTLYDDRFGRVFILLPLGCGWFTAVSGLVLMASYIVSAEAIIAPFPEVVTTKPNAGLGFFAIGAALLFSQKKSRFSAAMTAIAILLATFVGLVTLAEHIGFIDWPAFDQLLARELPGAVGTSSPGRMAFPTALALTLQSLSIFAWRFSKRASVGQYAALVSGLVGLVTLAGYAYGAGVLYGWWRLSQISPQSAFLVVISSIGSFALPADRGIAALLTSERAGGVLARRLLPVSIVLPISIGWARLQAQRAGWFDTETGLAIFACSNVVTFFILIWRSATWLNIQDEARARDQERINFELEQRVATRTAELRSSTQFFRTLVANLPDVLIVVFDFDLRLTLVEGERLLTAFGIVKKDLEGRFFHEVTSAANAAVLDHLYRAALRGQSDVVEVSRGGKDLRVHVVPIVDGNGTITAGMSVSYDVTRLKQAAIAIRDSALHFRRLIEAMPQVAIAHRRGKVVYANPSAAKALAFSAPADLIGVKLLSLIHPDDRQLAVDRIEVLLAHGVTQGPTIVRIVRRDQVEIIAEVIDLQLPFEGETVVFSLAQDITDRVTSERALRATSSFRQAILDGADYSIIATTTDGVITEFNQAAQRMLGYERDEVVNRTTPAILHLEEEIVARAERLSAELGQAIAPGFEVFVAKARLGAIDENEWTYIRKDGTRFPVRLSVTALKGVDDTVVGFLGVAQDISVQRRTQQDLIEAKEAAESAARARTTFLARMSHELRTPINGVMGMLELASQTPLSQEQRLYVETANTSAHTLLLLVNDILDFSKVDLGKMQLERVDFSLGETVALPLRALASAAERKGIEIVLRLPVGRHDHLNGDPLRLQQVLVNLVANALKFTQRGEVEVSAAVTEESETAVTLAFSVRDTGIGIPQSKQKQIFEAFNQGDETTTRVFGGTGLGLTIASDLVRLMGGTLAVDSEEGRGSTFRFVTQFSKAATRRQAAGLDSLHRDTKVLIVAENAKQTEVLTELVSGWKMPARSITVDKAAGRLDVTELRADVAVYDGTAEGACAFLSGAIGLNVSRVVVISTKPPAPLPDIWRGRVTHHHKPLVASLLLESLTGAFASSDSVVATPPPAQPVATKSLSILLVDDNVTNQLVGVGLLEKIGHRVTVVADGLQAVAAVGASAFDLVLMDMQMPKMDGFEAMRIIRSAEHERGGHVPIIAVTAQAMEGDRERCLDAGADEYVTKPLSIDVLIRVMNKLFGEGAHAKKRASRSEQPAFDRQAFLSRMAGDALFMKEVAEVFLASLPALRRSLARAVADQDTAAVERCAHALNGTLANVEATPARELAAQLEVSMRAPDAAIQSHLVSALDMALDQLVEDMQKLIAETSSA